jgi:hypothetical protein
MIPRFRTDCPFNIYMLCILMIETDVLSSILPHGAVAVLIIALRRLLIPFHLLEVTVL